MKDIYKWLFGPLGRAAIASPAPIEHADDDGGKLPPDLAHFAAAIEATALPCLSAVMLDDPPLHAAASQLGGRPWWPAGMSYPKDKSGAPLYLLAQFNLGNAPALEGLPASGLLQFFIGASESYGANFDKPLKPSGFRCVYHPALGGPQDTDSAPRMAPDGMDATLPLHKPLSPIALSLIADRMVIDATDYRFESLLPEISADETLLEAYADWAGSGCPAIRLGGYPSFTQMDPRAFGSRPAIGTFSLLTVDTTEGIMWGDSGVAQFFIRPEDLLARDFSQVAYNWDCC